MEMLCIAQPHSEPGDPQARRRFYVPGAPVVVRPDGWQWGRCEVHPKFWQLRIPNVPVWMGEQFCAPAYQGLLPGWKYGLEPVVAMRRRFAFTPEALGARDRWELMQSGRLVLAWDSCVRAMVDQLGLDGRRTILRVA
jgi:hypothetical protein